MSIKIFTTTKVSEIHQKQKISENNCKKKRHSHKTQVSLLKDCRIKYYSANTMSGDTDKVMRY